MHAATKWLIPFLLGVMMGPACHHTAEPAKAHPQLDPDAGSTPSDQPTDQPGIKPDTGAPIGPVARPGVCPYYDDGLYAAPSPSAGSGGVAGGGSGAAGGSAGSGGGRLFATTRHVVAL